MIKLKHREKKLNCHGFRWQKNEIETAEIAISRDFRSATRTAKTFSNGGGDGDSIDATQPSIVSHVTNSCQCKINKLYRRGKKGQTDRTTNGRTNRETDRWIERQLKNRDKEHIQNNEVI